MVKLYKSQLAKVAVVALLFLVTPLLSASMRSSYLYVLLNLIIIVLAMESGYLSPFAELPDRAKPIVVAATSECSSNMDCGTSSTLDSSPESFGDGSKTVEKPKSVGKASVVARMHKVKKGPSMQSLFFIGGGDVAEEEAKEEEEEDREGEVEVQSRQELFVKAETFISNFYNQLKMQREESWQKIHGLYYGASRDARLRSLSAAFSE